VNVWEVIVIPVLTIIGSFVASLYITPLLLFLGNRIMRGILRLRKGTPESIEKTSYKIGSVYVPEYIEYFGRLLHPNERKHRVVASEGIEELNQRDTDPLRDNRTHTVDCPLLELGDKESCDCSHLRRTISCVQKRINRNRGEPGIGRDARKCRATQLQWRSPDAECGSHTAKHREFRSPAAGTHRPPKPSRIIMTDTMELDSARGYHPPASVAVLSAPGHN